MRQASGALLLGIKPGPQMALDVAQLSSTELGVS